MTDIIKQPTGPCIICKTECRGTSWSLNLNCWVWICSEQCLACKNNPEAYEIIKQQIHKELKRVLKENRDKTFLPKGYTDDTIRHP